MASPVEMCPHTGKVLRDPIMISLTFFTLIFIITISLACAQPWKVPSGLHRGRRVRDTEPPAVSDCLVTYQAFQPNMDFFKEKLAEITVDKCSQGRAGHKKKQRRNKKRKNKRKNKRKKGKRNPSKSKKLKKPKNSRKTRKLPDRKRKRKKIHRELRTFRRWKSLMSGRAREGKPSSPAAQRALTSLWSDLLEAGPHWKNILRDLQHLQQHNTTSLPALPSHSQHSLRSE